MLVLFKHYSVYVNNRSKVNLYVYEFSVIADQVFDQIYNIFVFYTFCGLLL